MLFMYKELIGEPAGKLHTGRSRNDQVATDMRIWIRDAIACLKEHMRSLMSVMVQRADRYVNIV